MGDWETFKKLSWSQLWKVRRLAGKAESAAERFYPLWSQEDGPGDAFRHAYWSALMTRHLGYATAKYVGDQHEQIEGNPAKRKAMDLHNNHLGRQIALQRPGASDQELAADCQKAIQQGRALLIVRSEQEARRLGGDGHI